MSTVTLHTRAGPVEMPSATLMSRAAQRVAEALGWPPEPRQGRFALQLASGQVAPEDAVVAEFDGQRVELALVQR